MVSLKLWNIVLCFLTTATEPRETKQGYVGETIIMEVGNTYALSTLYNYDQMVALLVGSVCSILTDSYWYGRLRCTGDVSDKMYKIIIENVTQRDAGLYKVVAQKNESWRCFFNIKENATRAIVGDNVTIGWFFNQGRKTRSLKVIHPNQEVMMLLPPTNIPQIKSEFQRRMLYSGDASESYMSFTLLNIRMSDAGLYTIETVHGNTITGSKKLIVEAETKITHRTDEPPVPQSSCHLESVVWGAACLIILMTVCLICMQRRNYWRLKEAQRHLLEKSETVFLTTLNATRRHLPMPLLEEVRTDQSITESSGVCNAVLDLHYAASNDLASAHTECSSNYSHVPSEFDKLTVDNDMDCNKSSDKFKVTASTLCHDDVEEGILLVGSPSISTCVTTVDIGEYRYNGKVQRQVAHTGLALYAKVKKRSKVSSRSTELASDNFTISERTGALYGYGSEMIDISHNVGPLKTSQEDEIFSVSTRTKTQSCRAPLSPKDKLVQETKKDNEYETAVTPINPRSTDDVKVFEDDDKFATMDK